MNNSRLFEQLSQLLNEVVTQFRLNLKKHKNLVDN